MNDAAFLATAGTFAERGAGRTFPNPNVGCVIVKDGRVIGRGWTQPGGRPHAEAMALAQAGEAARGATLYTTLEPCAHASPRGPTCSTLIAEAGIARTVYAVRDPDPRTNGRGASLLGATHLPDAAATRAMAGFLTRQSLGRPHVTLKLALSIDGCIATASGQSQWITGPQARAHTHLERARADAILVGRGTYETDAPRLDVRLPGLETRSPGKYILSETRSVRFERVEGQSGVESTSETDRASTGSALAAWGVVDSVEAVAALPANTLLVEGGAQTAASFLAADLVDRLLIYRAPIVIGGKPGVGDIGLTNLATAHDRWTAVDSRSFGHDLLDIYERVRD